MKKYLGLVKIKGHYVKTVIFADSVLHAKLLFEYHYGWDCLLNNPTLLSESPADSFQPTITPPKANLAPTISFKKQKALVQKKKMNALIQQHANNELKTQAIATPLDRVAAIIKLGDIKRNS